MRKFIVMSLVTPMFWACTTHIAPYQPKKRRFAPGEYAARPVPNEGSLYAGARGLFEDVTASQVGDILVIQIDERESASRDASTSLAKKNESSYAVPNAFGLVAALQEKFPKLDPSALFGSNYDKKFDGEGTIERKGSLTATLPVRVRRVLPNGDLYIEGTKVVMVGHEEHHLYISGLVRRADVSANNTVPSSRVADAEIEYAGRGDVSAQQRQGWFSRLMSKIWPF